jgi:C4-dicarboxylate-specific signal transduction histidine kinase
MVRSNHFTVSTVRLSLVDRVARAPGGVVRAGNRDDGGARVTIALPSVAP